MLVASGRCGNEGKIWDGKALSRLLTGLCRLQGSWIRHLKDRAGQASVRAASISYGGLAEKRSGKEGSLELI
jgi:hypothetical protein